MLVPLLLWAMGLAGGCLVVAACIGALVYTNNVPVFRFGGGDTPPAAVAEPAVPKKKYSAATVRAMREAMQKITQVLDHEGMNAVREIETVASGPGTAGTKQQVYELIGRLDRMRNLARAVESIIWIDVLPAYPKISSELQDIVKERGSLQSFEAASKLYFDGLTTVVSLYDKVDVAGKENLLQLLNPTREAFRQAASNFQTWIQDCKSRIEEKQKALT
jgi:hypothetical protein